MRVKSSYPDGSHFSPLNHASATITGPTESRCVQPLFAASQTATPFQPSSTNQPGQTPSMWGREPDALVSNQFEGRDGLQVDITKHCNESLRGQGTSVSLLLLVSIIHTLTG